MRIFTDSIFLSADIQNLECLQNVDLSISVFQYLLLNFAFEFIFVLAASLIVSALSEFTAQFAVIIISAGIFVLPGALSSAGISALSSISASRLFNFNSVVIHDGMNIKSFALHIVLAAAAVLLLYLSERKWCSTREQVKNMKIEIKELTKEYGSNTALDNVSLCLTDGIYGILGPNGSGKTTIINLLTDNVKRTHGEILIEGKDILSLGAKYRNTIGYMPQQQAIYNEFSADMYLKYICSVKGIKHAGGLVNNLLKKVNLYNERNSKAGTFSGGMKQRLMLAQALLGDPKILILDEPTAGLDPKERINFRNMLAELSKDKIILLATHIVSDIECIADEVILLKKGKLIKKDTPENLMSSIADKVFEIRGSKEKTAVAAAQRRFLGISFMTGMASHCVS